MVGRPIKVLDVGVEVVEVKSGAPKWVLDIIKYTDARRYLTTCGKLGRS